MKHILPAGALACMIAVLIIGCATLNPAADSLVVRAEQTETSAKASLDFIVQAHDVNRSFWITNAPAYNNFVEWLRQPVTNASYVLPRGLAMIQQVDEAKVSYIANKSQSNAVLIAISALNEVVAQSQAWNVIVTTKKP